VVEEIGLELGRSWRASLLRTRRCYLYAACADAPATLSLKDFFKSRGPPRYSPALAGRSRRPQRCRSPVRSSSAQRIGYALVAFPLPNVGLMRKSALEVIGTIRLTLAGTLLVVGFGFVAPLPGQAVELVDPHTVLEETRRDLIELDRRMERYRAERQKEEVRQKRETAERAKSDKALEEVRRKREIAEQEKRVREEKEREAQRRTQEAADREKSEAALRETQRQRDAAEEQKRARDVEEREARQKQEIAEREKAEKATQEAQRNREATAEQERARDKERATEKERREASPKQRYSLRGEFSNRVDRRSACQQQAEEKGLSGRQARRYTRLCFSGLPIPDSLRR
jgi:hypothetical protein